MKGLLYFFVLVMICTVIYFKLTSDNSLMISTDISAYNLKLKVKEYYNSSGEYLRISGKFENNDTLFEYVFYSRPFSLGPIEKLNPVKKITIGKDIPINQDYYACLSKNDSLFNDSEAFPMASSDIIILKISDSLIKMHNSETVDYSKRYQSLLQYSKQILSETDNGLFFQTNK